jgi:signal transduction histidine kinase/CheY-like chemotaxis protein/streptogramin lyase
MTRIGAWLALLLAPCLALAGLPETPHPRQISVADGLPSNRINNVTEDRQGYLWIATDDGLARYDGIGFRVWQSEQGLRDNKVWDVHVDARDRLWIATADAGLAMLDPERNAFQWYDRKHYPAMGADSVWSVTSTPDGAIWFGTSTAGLHRLTPDGRITRFMPRANDPRSLPDAAVTHLEVAPDGSLWVATKGGPARWNGHDFERVPLSALKSKVIDGLSIQGDGTIWFGTAAGVSERTPKGLLITSPWDAYGSEPVYRVLHGDEREAYWLDIAEGLGRINEGRIVNVPLYSAAAEGVVKPTWSSGYEDRSGGLWFASVAHGLWYLPANWSMFSVLARRANDDTSIANAHVRGIAPSRDGTMWLVGSGGMLDRLDPETGAVEHVRADIGDSFVPASVLEDSRGILWIGYQSGVARFDPADGSLRRWRQGDATDAALTYDVAKLVESADGDIWMASDDGDVQVRDPDGHVRLSMTRGDGHGIPAGAEIRQLGLGPDGAVWVAGTHGLSVWNDGARRFEPVPGAPPTLICGYAEQDRHTIWLARPGSLQRYGWDGARLRLQDTVDYRDGVPLIAPSGLTVDASGILWATSVRGLIRVDTQARSVRVYGVHDGLPSQEFNGPPVPRPADGRILIGSPDGLVIFDPNVVRPSADVPVIAVETIGARRGEQLIDFPAGKPFTIENGDRDLRIVARVLSFSGALANRYRFRLDGYDDHWVEVNAHGERLFSLLKPGAYTLRVQGRTADGVWSKISTIAFDVAPPWWRTWWAIALWALLAALALYWLQQEMKARLKRRNAWQLAKHKHELAEQASLAKTRFLATLGHEVRTPMTGVLGMSELLLATPLDERQRGYIQSIRRAGDHLMRLVNDALDLARIEAGKLELDLQSIDLHALLEDVIALMAPLARRRGLVFRQQIAADTPRWVRGDPMRLRQILLNLLGNAIKFTERGEIGLHAQGTADGARFVVSDTGPGLSEEQRQRLFRRFEQAEGARTAARYGGSGLGLAICQELASAMDGHIEVDSVLGEGTRFSVELPFAPADSVPAAKRDVHDGAGTATARDLLLVEDDPTVAEVISELLRVQGHRVVHAANGLGALSEIASARFDLALLDLDLPGIDGLALARQMRAFGFDKPLIAVTARADADAEPLARAAGFDDFLRKPVTGEMLADAIAQRLNP